MNQIMEPVLLVLLVAFVLIFAGNLLGKLVPPLDRFALPGAVIGGLLALACSPQLVKPGSWPLVSAESVEQFYEQLSGFPGLFINVVFACLMLGRRFGSLQSIWQRARSQIVMGHVFAWGQYFVGLTLAVAVLQPLLGVSVLSGTLIAIGFQGGHGTAAGLGSSFENLDFADGEAFGLAMATFGVLVGVVGGPFLANRLKPDSASEDEDGMKAEKRGDGEREEDRDDDRPAALRPNPLTGRLTVHLALVALVIGLGWSILQGLRAFEVWLRPEETEMYLADFLPLFSMVLLAGMAVQLLLGALGWDRLFERDLFEKISSVGLDLVIFSALATLSLEVIGSNWIALLILCLAGLLWNLFVLLWAGPRVYRKPWAAYGVGDFGGGTATTASGILLIQVVDPDGETDALKAYTEKQPFYEPIMGGGLVTALALPTVAAVGPWIALAIVGAILAGWCAIAVWIARD